MWSTRLLPRLGLAPSGGFQSSGWGLPTVCRPWGLIALLCREHVPPGAGVLQAQTQACRLSSIRLFSPHGPTGPMQPFRGRRAGHGPHSLHLSQGCCRHHLPRSFPSAASLGSPKAPVLPAELWQPPWSKGASPALFPRVIFVLLAGIR